MNEPIECIEGPDGCVGTVEFRPAPPHGERSFARCEAHQEARWARYEDSESVERWADMATPPDWFDPADAGESWDGE
jgi:hypothetical protein